MATLDESVPSRGIEPVDTIVEALKDEPPFLTREEVAKILRVNVATISRLISRGFLRSVRLNTGGGHQRIRIAKTELEKYLFSSSTR